MRENSSVPLGEPCSPPESSSVVVQAAAIRDHAETIKLALLDFDGHGTRHERQWHHDRAIAALDALVAVVAAAGPPEEDLGAGRARREGVKVTHGRHCRCSACAREDWTRITGPCGMHGDRCPAVYAPLDDTDGECDCDREGRSRGDECIYTNPCEVLVRRPLARLGSSVETGRRDETS